MANEVEIPTAVDACDTGPPGAPGTPRPRGGRKGFHGFARTYRASDRTTEGKSGLARLSIRCKSTPFSLLEGGDGLGDDQ